MQLLQVIVIDLLKSNRLGFWRAALRYKGPQIIPAEYVKTK